jgi:hypothetical protein
MVALSPKLHFFSRRYKLRGCMVDAVEKLISEYPPELQPIVRALQEVARRAMPDFHEFVYHSTLAYAPIEPPFDRVWVCYIAPQRGYVNLGFSFGIQLPDPEKLLQGTGARMRHVKVRSVEEANNPALEALVEAAHADAPTSIATLHANRKKSK